MTWPATLSASPAFNYVPDNCGNGGSIGIRFVAGGPYEDGTEWLDFYSPYGSCPDFVQTALLGTSTFGIIGLSMYGMRCPGLIKTGPP